MKVVVRKMKKNWAKGECHFEEVVIEGSDILGVNVESRSGEAIDIMEPEQGLRGLTIRAAGNELGLLVIPRASNTVIVRGGS